MSDSYNHVFKQSVNSLDKRFISGGSSGGEGALVGALGSIMGVGTDIGGSIRIPAVLQGLYGLNPTIGRFPNDSSGKNQKYIAPPVGGPLTTSLSSLEFFMETLLSSDPWNLDPQLIPIPWRKELAHAPENKLKIGFVYDDGIVKPQPPAERVARELAQKLKDAGHEVVEWDTSSHAAGYALWLECVLADGGADARSLCELAGEPLVEGMLVGLPEHEKTVMERRQVSLEHHFLNSQSNSLCSLTTKRQPFNERTSSVGLKAESTRSLCQSSPGSPTHQRHGSRANNPSPILQYGTC